MGALISVVPALQAYVLPLCLTVLVVVTLVNLRGTTEAGRLWALPTYVFILGLLAMIAIGSVRVLVAHGAPTVLVAPAAPPRATREAAGLWLMLRAFAAGCTAMTGVEAVSNGVGAFKEPRVKRARLTLSLICGALGLLLAGIALLAKPYHVGALDQTKAGYQSVISQLVGALIGRGAVYDVVMASVLAVLVLSANTSMVGFPRLCRMVAEDDYLPRAFALAGRRLVYTAGILFLAGAAGVLLIVFQGVTDRLIPLFAVGAFLTFTLSQAGMVMHWRKVGGRGAMAHLAINALGASATAAALVIIVAAKFTEGAWITIIALPATVAGLTAIRRYYDRLGRAIATDVLLPTTHLEPPIILVPVASWDAPTAHAVSYAMRLSARRGRYSLHPNRRPGGGRGSESAAHGLVPLRPGSVRRVVPERATIGGHRSALPRRAPSSHRARRRAEDGESRPAHRGDDPGTAADPLVADPPACRRRPRPARAPAARRRSGADDR